MRGRKPIPTALRVLRGVPGKHPPADEPRPAVGVPDCPAHLNDEARAEWGRISEELVKVGLLTKVERSALAAYCVSWSRWVDAELKVQQFGLLMKTPSGYFQQSPYVGIANKAMEQMRKFLAEFGMTPSSRARVGKARTAAPDNRFSNNGRAAGRTA